MKIVERYSHLNGLEYLLVHRKKLWRELQGVIAQIDASALKTKASQEKGVVGELKYSPKALNAEFSRRLASLGWNESRVTHDQQLIRRTMTMTEAAQKLEIERMGLHPIKSYNQTDFVKNRVALEVQFGKYAFVAYDLFVKHLAFYVRDEIDVGIELLPMKSMQAEMSSGPGYYEGELYNVLRNGRGVPAVPLVVLGVAP